VKRDLLALVEPASREERVVANHNVPEDCADALREMAMMLRAGVHPDEIRSPQGNEVPCGEWLADFLENIAGGASVPQALGLRGRPQLSDGELRRIYGVYLKARVSGRSHRDSLEAIEGTSARNAEKAIREAERRGVIRKLSAQTVKDLQKVNVKK
jgi:hypothetical protein